MFEFLKKTKLQSNHDDNHLYALAKCQKIDITRVSDEVFAKQIMGQTVAFTFNDDIVTLCAPCNGNLSVVYPTGHCFGITMNNGIEILVHIGVNTVENNGIGFETLRHKGDNINAGDAIVKVHYKELSKKYDMSTMLIILNSNNHNIQFIDKNYYENNDVLANII